MSRPEEPGGGLVTHRDDGRRPRAHRRAFWPEKARLLLKNNTYLMHHKSIRTILREKTTTALSGTH